jgi:hypothetical protein
MKSDTTQLMAKHFSAGAFILVVCNSLVLRVSEIWQFAFPTFVASNNCAGDRFKQAGI